MLVIEKAIDIVKSMKYKVEDTDCTLHKILNDMNLKTCDCGTTSCNKCLKQSLTLLSQEYKEPIELTQFEFDLLKTIEKYNKARRFNEYIFTDMKMEKGYFKGIKDISMTIEEILDNCVVKDDAH